MGLTIIDNNNIFQKDVIGNVRTAQEDSHDIAVCTPNGDVFVVCDGMGGHVGGKQASGIAVKSIIDYLKREKYGNAMQALNDALQYANLQILGYASEHPELKGMGTTACIVLLQNTEAYIAHVGDSRIYLYLGEEKQLNRITKDHSFVQALVDSGQITDEEAEHHPNKNRILKALGIKQDLKPSIDVVSPKNGDVFLICSDGLSGMISDAEIRGVLMQKNSVQDKGETLIDLALTAGGLDNITLELIQIVSSPHKKSIFKSYNPNVGNGKSGDKSGGKPKIIKIITITSFVLVFCALIGILDKMLLDKRKDQNIKHLEIEIGRLREDSISLCKKIDNAKIDYESAKKAFEDAQKDCLDKRLLDRYEQKAKDAENEISIIKQKQEVNGKLLKQKADSLNILTQNR